MSRFVLVFVDVRDEEYPKRYLDKIVELYGWGNVFVMGDCTGETPERPYRHIDVPNPTLLRQGARLITTNHADMVAYKGETEHLHAYK